MDSCQNTVRQWTPAAENYSRLIKNELEGPERRAWADIILNNAPKKDNLKVLDIGTGPGFFAIIMAEPGHDVTAIDCTETMLEQARENAANENVTPEFLLMDSHKLDFPDNSFDLIICRNVTWTLYSPNAAFAEWKRVLKPGGRLTYFDANWYIHFFDPEARTKIRDGILAYKKKYGDPPPSYSMNKIESYWIDLPLSGIDRPKWDTATLWKLGFQDISTDVNLREKLPFDEKRDMLYGASPMFMVSALKTDEKTEKLAWLTGYWSGSSPEWRSACGRDLASFKHEAYRALFGKYITDEKKRVLDLGTGGGFISILLALQGHEVTGVDMSESMLCEAAVSAREHGVAVNFIKADITELPFAGQSFDALICRNVTWLLQDPDRAYAEWRRVLAPDGVMVYIDAHWYLHLHDEEHRVKYEKDRSKAVEKGILPARKNSIFLEEMAFDLPLSKFRRPDWDRENLPRLGFEIIDIQENINHLVAAGDELLRWASTPMFILAAKKNVLLGD